AAQATRQRLESPAKPQEFIERAQAVRAEFDANKQRRDRLTPEERLKEDGESLFQSLKSSPDSVLILQLTQKPVFRRARCRANECLYGSFNGRDGTEIQDKYRISLEWGEQAQLEYYHVRCMECMVPLPALARSQFKLDGRASWSLMIGKWMEHRGRINIEKIAAYIDREAAYSRWFRDTINEISNIELRHQLSCKTAGVSCQCPPFPCGPKVPVLKEYITSEDEVCGL
ncbi:hypothetical protein BGZ61DRAFT_312808, partial [Ilyonectria robusta]|uniref:uncharacterized protein n=1 Tax=Ilyonectria robusta TaxID=1079257 RepID=UPI001E8E43AE